VGGRKRKHGEALRRAPRVPNRMDAPITPKPHKSSPASSRPALPGGRNRCTPPPGCRAAASENSRSRGTKRTTKLRIGTAARRTRWTDV
jgi:hypothetical protein